jgi:RNA polymerase sigma factor (sigma-70 family)
MSDFRPLTESDLLARTPEELIAYHHEARRLGRHDEARTALAILAWGFRERVEFWVSRKVPKEDVEDVVDEVIESALRSSFDRGTPGQFGAWLRRIAQRRVADYHAAESRRPDQVPLPEEHEGSDEIWGAGGEVPDPMQEVVEMSVVEQALRELSEVHRRVVELAGSQDLGFEQRTGKETARLVNDQLSVQMDDPMTETNVHQILSRFRKRLAELLDDAGGGGGG